MLQISVLQGEQQAWPRSRLLTWIIFSMLAKMVGVAGAVRTVGDAPLMGVPWGGWYVADTLTTRRRREPDTASRRGLWQCRRKGVRESLRCGCGARPCTLRVDVKRTVNSCGLPSQTSKAL